MWFDDGRDDAREEKRPVILPAEVNDDVVRYYSPMVWRIALTKTKSHDDAEDIFQEVFLRLLRNTKPFLTEEHRKAWLIRVTLNCCNSHFVAPWKRNVCSLSDIEVGDILDESTDEDEKIDVYAEVMRLPENMREVILLFYFEGMSVREIAEAVGTTEVNVKKRLSRARERLRLGIGGEK